MNLSPAPFIMIFTKILYLGKNITLLWSCGKPWLIYLVATCEFILSSGYQEAVGGLSRFY